MNGVLGDHGRDVGGNVLDDAGPGPLAEAGPACDTWDKLERT